MRLKDHPSWKLAQFNLFCRVEFFIPIDRAGLLVAFNDMGPWNDTSIHFQRRIGLGDSHLDFGVYHGNGHTQAWAAGMHPETYLNRQSKPDRISDMDRPHTCGPDA